MNLVFIEPEERNYLYPLNLGRPNAVLRMGAFTFEERWLPILNPRSSSYCTEVFMSAKYPMHVDEENVFLNPLFLPNDTLVKSISELQKGEALFSDSELVAFKGSFGDFKEKNYKIITSYGFEAIYIKYPWDLFNQNEVFLNYDINCLIENGDFIEIPEHVRITGDRNKIFIENGAILEHCILNTSEGNIYISNGAVIQENAVIRGTTFIGENAVVKTDAKIYGDTTIGPYCKVGGELNNAVIMQYSNKGHDGFLGNSVIGEWCNLGADTNNSNLKNTYSDVDCWSEIEHKYVDTGLQFCGLMMGDHSKSAINTQFNTGTEVGFSSNIFMSGFPPKNMKSFCFGGEKSGPKTRLDSAIQTATKMMERRKIEFSEADKQIFTHIYENS